MGYCKDRRRCRRWRRLRRRLRSASDAIGSQVGPAVESALAGEIGTVVLCAAAELPPELPRIGLERAGGGAPDDFRLRFVASDCFEAGGRTLAVDTREQMDGPLSEPLALRV